MTKALIDMQDIDNPNNGIWVNKQGNATKITDMSERHLKNCIKHLDNMKTAGNEYFLHGVYKRLFNYQLEMIFNSESF